MKKFMIYLKNFLVKLSILRFIFIPVLKKLNFEFKWKHDLTNRSFYLQSYYHKGYWFYGKNREKDELDIFQKLIEKGDTVLEVGTHIGYLTQYFEFLVGNEGQVFAVEPTPNSIYYLKKNVCPKTVIIDKAASNKCGEVEFFIEEFGGFTNSLISEFTQSQNELHQKFQHINSNISSIKVKTDTLDNICVQNNILPNFIKIDVEGAEYDVLRGAKRIIKDVNAIMVEITRNENDVIGFLNNIGFKKMNVLNKSKNIFFVK